MQDKMAKFVAIATFLFALLDATHSDVVRSSETVIPSKPGETAPFSLPVGTILMYGSDGVPPAPWLLCDGSEVSRFIYKSLFSVIGTKYGPGDNVKTFNLPDLRGRTALGVDQLQLRVNGAQAVGLSGGKAKHQLSLDQLPLHSHNQGTYKVSTAGAHSHGVVDPGHNHGGHTGPGNFGPGSHGMTNTGNFKDFNSHTHTIPMGTTGISLAAGGDHVHEFRGESGAVGGNQPFDTVSPFQTVNYVIYAG